ncbi:MAG: hypothetical protein ACRETL_02985, partial [Gammaproteobacteria bacterium]
MSGPKSAIHQLTKNFGLPAVAALTFNFWTATGQSANPAAILGKAPLAASTKAPLAPSTNGNPSASTNSAEELGSTDTATPRLITLDEAIHAALQHNLDIKIQRFA